MLGEFKVFISDFMKEVMPDIKYDYAKDQYYYYTSAERPVGVGIDDWFIIRSGLVDTKVKFSLKRGYEVLKRLCDTYDQFNEIYSVYLIYLKTMFKFSKLSIILYSDFMNMIRADNTKPDFIFNEVIMSNELSHKCNKKMFEIINRFSNDSVLQSFIPEVLSFTVSQKFYDIFNGLDYDNIYIIPFEFTCHNHKMLVNDSVQSELKHITNLDNDVVYGGTIIPIYISGTTYLAYSPSQNVQLYVHQSDKLGDEIKKIAFRHIEPNRFISVQGTLSEITIAQVTPLKLNLNVIARLHSDST